MRNFVLFAAAAAGIGASGMSTPDFGQGAASVLEQNLRVQTSFDLMVHASYAETTPLFGPEVSVRGRASTGIPSLSILDRRGTRKAQSSPSSMGP